MHILEKLYNLTDSDIVIKRIKISLHLIFVSTVTILMLIKMVQYINRTTMLFFTSDAFEFFLITVTTYIGYFFLIKQKGLLRKFLLIMTLLIPVVIMGYHKFARIELRHIRGLTLEQLANYTSDYTSSIFDVSMNYIGMMTMVLFLIFLISNVNYLFNRNYFALKKALEKTEHELLKQQFNPHFLYNALNSIYSLSLNNNPNTPDTILKLSNMMRFLTDEIPNKNIQLNTEIDFIKEYIEIEKVRFGRNKNIRFTVTGNTDSTIIEPLLLFPLVENAFKHSDRSGKISIDLTLEDNTISFCVKNNIQKTPNQNRKGKGLELLKQRLSLSYPTSSSLETNITSDIYSTTLNITTNV